MKLIKAVRNLIIIAAIATSASYLTGCGGLSEAQMEELKAYEVKSVLLKLKQNPLRMNVQNLKEKLQRKTPSFNSVLKKKQKQVLIYQNCLTKNHKLKLEVYS